MMGEGYSLIDQSSKQGTKNSLLLLLLLPQVNAITWAWWLYYFGLCRLNICILQSLSMQMHKFHAVTVTCNILYISVPVYCTCVCVFIFFGCLTVCRNKK